MNNFNLKRELNPKPLEFQTRVSTITLLIFKYQDNLKYFLNPILGDSTNLLPFVGRVNDLLVCTLAWYTRDSEFDSRFKLKVFS